MEATVVLVTDGSHAADAVEAALKEDVSDLRRTADEAEAARILDSEDVAVVVYGLASLQDAVAMQVNLYRSLSRTRHKYQTLVLVAEQDIKSAFDYCIRDIFDDYAVATPLQDIHRIRLSVHLAVQRRATEQEAKTEAARAADALDEARIRTEGTKKVVERSQTELGDTLADEIAGLAAEMKKPEMADTVKVVDEAKLDTHLRTFTETRVRPAVERSRASIDAALNEMAEVFARKYEEHVGGRSRRASAAPAAPAKPAAEPAKRQAPAADKGKGAHILVVDDDPTYGEIVKGFLEESGFRVTLSPNGQQALTLMARERPALVLMDFEMPVMNGAETTRRMKAHPMLRNIPVIMLTGHSGKEVIQASLKAGATDFILKPGERASMTNKILSHLP